MTEITAKIDWPILCLALLSGPAIANTVLILPTVIFPPALLVGLIIGLVSICLGYLTYLILGVPLMGLAQLLGLNHPVFHGLIGYGAAWLMPLAEAAGLPLNADPAAMANAQWAAPLWCMGAAIFYDILRRECGPLDEVPL